MEKKKMSKKMKFLLFFIGFFLIGAILPDTRKDSNQNTSIESEKSSDKKNTVLEHSIIFESTDYTLATLETDLETATSSSEELANKACYIARQKDSNEVQLIVYKKGSNYIDGYIGTALCYDGDGSFDIPSDEMRENYISLIGHYYTLNDIVDSFMYSFENDLGIMPFYAFRPLTIPVKVDDIVNINGKWYIKELSRNPLIKYALYEYAPSKDRPINKGDRLTINGKLTNLEKDHIVVRAERVTKK